MLQKLHQLMKLQIPKVAPVNEITDSKLSIFKIGKSECDINNVMAEHLSRKIGKSVYTHCFVNFYI
jgi:hypothetical protein